LLSRLAITAIPIDGRRTPNVSRGAASVAAAGITIQGVARPAAPGIDDHAAAQILDRNSAMTLLVCRPAPVAPNSVAIERTPV
jgi:hypothetical protein